MTLNALPLSDLAAVPPAPVDWLVRGLIPAGQVCLMASQPNQGKSFLNLQLQVSLALGQPFLGYDVPTKRSSAYLSLEDPQPAVHRRLWAIQERYKHLGIWTPEYGDALQDVLLLTPNYEAQGCTTALAPLVPVIDEALAILQGRQLPLGLFTIDTFAQASTGDENSAKDVRPVITAAFDLAGRWGVTPMFLHHAAKNQSGARSNEKRTLDDRMSMDWLRGSSALSGAARCILQLAPILPAEAEKVGLDPEKARRGGYQCFGASKQSNGPRGEWRLIEQVDPGEPGAGTWFPRHDSVEILAKLKGGKAVQELTKLDAILFDLWSASRSGEPLDRAALARKHHGEAKDPETALRGAIRRLRSNGFVQRNSLDLTASGFQRAVENARG